MTDVSPAETGDSGEIAGTRLVFVRHGESNVTVDRVIGGLRTCNGLSPLGIAQAQRLRERLIDTAELRGATLLSSTYPRAIETAEVIADALAPPGGAVAVQTDVDLGEHDPGPICDGMAFADFVDQYGMPDWESDPHATTFPGGETIGQFHTRVGATLHRLVARHRRGKLVIVCHGGVIDRALRTLLNAPITGAFELHTANTSLTEVRAIRPGRWQLVRYNDTAHLDGLEAASPAR